MAKTELGTKRVCPETGRKFYDLNKDPVISPYTGKVVPVETPTARSRPEPADGRVRPPLLLRRKKSSRRSRRRPNSFRWRKPMPRRKAPRRR